MEFAKTCSFVSPTHRFPTRKAAERNTVKWCTTRSPKNSQCDVNVFYMKDMNAKIWKKRFENFHLCYQIFIGRKQIACAPSTSRPTIPSLTNLNGKNISRIVTWESAPDETRTFREFEKARPVILFEWPLSLLFTCKKELIKIHYIFYFH